MKSKANTNNKCDSLTSVKRGFFLEEVKIDIVETKDNDAIVYKFFG